MTRTRAPAPVAEDPGDDHAPLGSRTSMPGAARGSQVGVKLTGTAGGANGGITGAYSTPVRAHNVDYQNTGVNARHVEITVANGQSFDVKTGPTTGTYVAVTVAPTTGKAYYSFFVPPGWFYQVTSATTGPDFWTEAN